MGQKLIKMNEQSEQFSFFSEFKESKNCSFECVNGLCLCVCVRDRASNETLRKMLTQFSLKFLGAKSQSSLFMGKPAYPIKPCINGGH